MTITVRVNNRELKVYYNEKFICSHERSYLKNKVFTTEAHRTGLLECKPGATRETWQLGYVKSLGPKMAEYVELVRQGPRSLKYELSRLVALVTVYGEAIVLSACGECLGSGIVGVDNRVEAEILGSGDLRGSGKDEGPGSGFNLEIPAPVDLQGEIGAAQFDDPEQNQNGEVPAGSNGGEL
jgi:hypothetical protein